MAVASGFRGTPGLSGPFPRHEGQSGKSDDGDDQAAWPSRPGEQQYGWEPARVVADTKLATVPKEIDQRQKPINQDGSDLRDEYSASSSAMADSHRVDRSEQAEGREHDRQAGPAGEELGDTGCERQEERQVEAGGSEQSDQDLADTSISRCDRRSDGSSGRSRKPGEVSVDAAGCGGQGNGMRKTQPAVGLHVDECSSVLGQALTLNPHGGNVFWNETIFKKTRAREVLFEVWHQAGTEGFQWETGRLQRFLEEKVLQSGVQLDGFTQRICFFVWCLQTGYQTQGWGLHGMQVYESSRNTSQGQEPMEQLKRELAYAMCQLSYEIALERGQDPVETTGIMQGVRESSERSWALSEALPEMEEVWRSTLDQTVWENGCFIEAASKGNRTDELRLLGNGVVPATAERAFRILMSELDIDHPVS
jgi:hypothetical protein